MLGFIIPLNIKGFFTFLLSEKKVRPPYHNLVTLFVKEPGDSNMCSIISKERGRLLRQKYTTTSCIYRPLNVMFWSVAEAEDINTDSGDGFEMKKRKKS